MKAAALLSSLMSGLLAAALAAPAVAAEATAPAKADLAKGEATATAVCGACHTFDGSRGSPANPILQGQHPEYLAKQLAEFKEGKRDNAVMKGFAAAMSEQDMRNVAAWLATQKAKPGFARDKELVKLGERIYRGGIADRQIAACAGCHSPNGAGIPAQYPRLSGQHPDYTAGQLRAFREGSRKNSAQMTQVAAHMTEREIQAVSDYIAGLR